MTKLHPLHNTATRLLEHLAKFTEHTVEELEPHRDHVLKALETAKDARSLSNAMFELEEKGIEFSKEIDPQNLNWMMPFVGVLSARDRLTPQQGKSDSLMQL